MANDLENLDLINEELKEAGADPVALQDDETGSKGEHPPKSDDESEEKDSEESEEESEEESGEETEEESEDEEEEDESKLKDEEDEDIVDSHQPRKQIPLTRYHKDTRRLKDEVEYWKERALSQGPVKAETERKDEDDLKETIRTLATELKTPEDMTEKLVTTIVNLARKDAIPLELQERLDALERRERAEESRQRFNDEWNGFLPTLREEFPNATSEQLSIAKQAMDIIAHSDEFHRIVGPHALEFIFNKTRDEDFVDILFSPKKKGFESSRISGSALGPEGKEFRIPDANSPTPESIAALEDFLNEASEAEGSNLRGTLPDGTPIRLS